MSSNTRSPATTAITAAWCSEGREVTLVDVSAHRPPASAVVVDLR